MFKTQKYMSASVFDLFKGTLKIFIFIIRYTQKVTEFKKKCWQHIDLYPPFLGVNIEQRRTGIFLINEELTHESPFFF